MTEAGPTKSHEAQRTRIYVGNLSEDIRPASIYKHFIKCGRILTIQKRYSKFAFVEFETVASAQHAIESLNGSLLGGHAILVNTILNEEEKKVHNGRKAAAVNDANGEINEPTASYVGRNSIFKQDTEVKCKLVIESISLRKYAESIIAQLTVLGIISTIFVMSPALDLHKVLGKFRGEAIDVAICVNKSSKTMQSMNVVGEPIRHNNIPMLTGIRLIYKHLKVSPQNPALHQHPVHISNFLRDLMDNQCLTVMQYDSLLSYLKARKDQQMKVEVGDSETFAETRNLRNFGAEQKAQVKDQIFEILTRKAEEKKVERSGRLTEAETKSLVDKLKKDSNVQSAIKKLKDSKSQRMQMVAGPSRAFEAGVTDEVA